MRRWALSMCAVTAVVAASASAGQASTPAGHRVTSFTWGALTHPALDLSVGQLTSVSAVSADDVWAVGEHVVQKHARTLVEHWDGTSWSVVPSPNLVGATSAILEGVDALSANNVWAVGEFIRSSGGYRTLVEHWNGAAWRRVPSPNPSTTGSGSLLTSVSAVSADEVWAVGYDDPPGPEIFHTLVMRWNGGSWSVVRSPVRPGVNRLLFGVSASSASSAWAVGITADRDSHRLKSLVEHWNGRRWNQAPIASPGEDSYRLLSVSLVAPGNAWAVGHVDGRSGGAQILIEHLSGGTWHRVIPRGLGGPAGNLTSVSGDGPDDVWAVGFVGSTSVLAHWDGRHWSLFHGANPSKTTLSGVTTNGTSATWAVGVQYRRLHGVTFTEHWNGHVWTR
jgi:hypothetical protein